MIRHASRFLTSLGIMAVIVAVPGAASATPGQTSSSIGVQAFELRCMRHFDTAYGPVSQATQRFNNLARAGYHSNITGEFNASTEWMTIWSPLLYQDLSVRATDGVVGQTQGWGALNTAYGPTVWATQYKPPAGSRQGRWGTWNLITDTFYPSSGWLPFSKDIGVPC